jgi:hypothetical protein
MTDIPEVSPQTSLREQKDREGKKDRSTQSGPRGPWMSVRKGNPLKKNYSLLHLQRPTVKLVTTRCKSKEVRTYSLVRGCTMTLIC